MPASDPRVLILGGTAEASRLAAALQARSVDVVTSLAGRTANPAPVAGSVRVGGFGGVEVVGLSDRRSVRPDHRRDASLCNPYFTERHRGSEGRGHPAASSRTTGLATAARRSLDRRRK
ncbi:hypothetical protein HED49_09725 [Ochrobactrum daejeonense]|nr:hypothetical protein [Brucella daejeonensis]